VDTFGLSLLVKLHSASEGLCVWHTTVVFNEGLWSIGIHWRAQRLWACAPGPSYLLSLSLSLYLTAFGTTLWYCHFHWTIQPKPHTHTLYSDSTL